MRLSAYRPSTPLEGIPWVRMTAEARRDMQTINRQPGDPTVTGHPDGVGEARGKHEGHAREALLSASGIVKSYT